MEKYAQLLLIQQKKSKFDKVGLESKVTESEKKIPLFKLVIRSLMIL
jgi:hypothetical protein